MENQTFTHILQKKGILKTFSVAKVVTRRDIAELEALIRSVSSSEEEYNQMLSEEIAKISNMHDQNNPVPGIIYLKDKNERKPLLFNISHKFCENIKKQKFTKQELAFLISSMIGKLDLSQEDFIKLNEEINGDDDDD